MRFPVRAWRGFGPLALVLSLLDHGALHASAQVAASNPSPPTSTSKAAQSETMPLAFGQKAFPDAIVGLPFHSSVHAIGGSGLYGLTVTGDLPPGMYVEKGINTIAVGGVPTQAGKYQLQIDVRDVNGAALQGNFTIRVSPRVLPLLTLERYITDNETFTFNDAESVFFPVVISDKENFSYTDIEGGMDAIQVSDNDSFTFTDSERLNVLTAQTITFPAPASPVIYPASPITLSATGGASGNPVVFSVLSGPGAVTGTNGTTLSFTNTGTVVIAANQAGNASYAAATQVTQSIVVIPSAPALLVLPTPGLTTVLGTTNVTFQWTTGTGVTEYQLNLSAVSPGASDLFLYKGTATSATASSLPAYGAEVYATLYSKINGVWQSNSYVYYESGPRPAQLTSPTPGLGTILGASNVTFQWTTGAEVADYQLNLSAIGQGQSELFSYKGTATSAVVSSLPANGATVYATLYSKINGVWQQNAYQYTESGTPTPATLTSPTPGLTTILGTSSVLFQWTAGGGASEFQLNLSAITPGASDLFVYKGTASSATVPMLPAHGVTVYATLYSKIKGTWQLNSYVYTESGSPTPAALTSPTPSLGTILGTTNVLFQWSAGTSASDYQLNLSTVAPGNSELYSYKGTALSATAPSLPANGVKVYARLYSKIDGNWLYNDYVYTEQ